MKKEALVLTSTEPINDGGKELNFLYPVGAVTILIVFVIIGSNFLGALFGAVLGLGVAWLIKNQIMDTRCVTVRDTKFLLKNKVPYSELTNRLKPILTPLGATIEVSSDQNSCPVIKYEGAYYDIVYNEDNTFLVWWRKSLVKALFKVNSIDAYRKEVAAMGIIGYHVQQICNHSIVEEQMMDIAEKPITQKKFCTECGNPITPGTRFCRNCGKELQ